MVAIFSLDTAAVGEVTCGCRCTWVDRFDFVGPPSLFLRKFNIGSCVLETDAVAVQRGTEDCCCKAVVRKKVSESGCR